MTYYEDLSSYGYFTETIPPDVSARAVGWLDPAHPFTRAEPDEAFADRLFALCRDHRFAITRGWHGCGLCRRRFFGGGRRAHPVTVARGRERILVGHGEVRVHTGADTWLIAPDMVAHYVLTHHYAPPGPFVEAVMAGRVVADSL
ncbi:hypothetical protein ACFYXS_12405 [Streptomyces sp. NPDC002574]|uniref:DUF7919 family protein n=1 Tax=Streptomyces sp. NPDC002574 TaxID=3364652 RepID=UPI00368BF1CA